MAAVAMAASAFAVDVAASASLSSDLFNYNTASNTVKVLDGIGMTGDIDTLKFAVSSDNAGASFRLRQQEKGEITAMGIWFKPADNLKLSFLENGLSLAADKAHWWDYYKKVNVGAGYGCEFTADALSVAVNVGPTLVNGSAIGEIGAKIGYNADFGSLAVIADFQNTFKAISVGASYENNFNGLTLVVNGGVWLNGGFEAAHGMVYAGMNVSGIDLKGLANVTYANNDVALAVVAKVGYNLGVCNATLFFDSDNLLGKTFARNWTDFTGSGYSFADETVGVEFAGSVGIASWTITPKYNLYKDTISVAFGTSVNY